MYYSLYSKLKELIASHFGLKIDERGNVQGSEELTDIQLFNNQYEEIIHATPVVFIEFGKLDISPLTKQSKSIPIQIRLHVVNQVLDNSDNGIIDSDFKSHEALADKVLEAVENMQLDFQNGKTRPLSLTGWQHYHRYFGFMVTVMELTTKG